MAENADFGGGFGGGIGGAVGAVSSADRGGGSSRRRERRREATMAIEATPVAAPPSPETVAALPFVQKRRRGFGAPVSGAAPAAGAAGSTILTGRLGRQSPLSDVMTLRPTLG